MIDSLNLKSDAEVGMKEEQCDNEAFTLINPPNLPQGMLKKWRTNLSSLSQQQWQQQMKILLKRQNIQRRSLWTLSNQKQRKWLQKQEIQMRSRYKLSRQKQKKRWQKQKIWRRDILNRKLLKALGASGFMRDNNVLVDTLLFSGSAPSYAAFSNLKLFFRPQITA